MADIPADKAASTAVGALIAATLLATRVDLSDEKAAQAQIAEALTAAGLAFEREARLSPRDRPDFLFPVPGLVLEVKLRARKMDIWRQLARYAEHERVRAIILASNTAMTLPPEIVGKPLAFVSLGRAWL